MGLSEADQKLVEQLGLLHDAWHGWQLTDADLGQLIAAARADDGGLRARLADNETLEWFIFEIFYANPIAFARKNLVIALQRHLLGLPLVTPEEAQRRMLDEMSDENRAAWWRAENARRLAVRGVEQVAA